MGKEYWSMTEGSYNCLLDHERNLAFRSALRAAVRPGDVVVDCGGGILSLFAVEAGASRVFCVEHDPRAARFLPGVFAAAGCDDKVMVLEQDALSMELPCPVDVVVCEMIATALIEELQVPVMNRAHCFASDRLRVVLNCYECWADIVHNPDQQHGYRFPVIRYEYKDWSETVSSPLTSKTVYAEIDFSRPVEDTLVDCVIPLTGLRAGRANGVRLGGLTRFYGGDTLADTPAYSYPIILPVDEIAVSEGDRFALHLRYRLCEGFGGLKYHLEKLVA
jgi:predicted RNA methylase